MDFEFVFFTVEGEVDNSLSQLTNIFKKYLVEPQETEQPISSQFPGSQTENRASVLDNLQNKLDGLKIQLGRLKTFPNFFHSQFFHFQNHKNTWKGPFLKPFTRPQFMLLTL